MHAAEVRNGQRFQFGANWASFLRTIDETRVCEAEQSLKEMLGVETLSGKRFLDAGSGSGLFSLAARRLGAEVHSFDYDPQSVACTRELKRRFFESDSQWTVDEASVLDPSYLQSLGVFDYVYSWGVLHHTGQMWNALENITIPIGPGGKLFISIYNNQGPISKYWTAIKKTYASGLAGRVLTCSLLVPYFTMRTAIHGVRKYGNPLSGFSTYKARRGMSAFHDYIDWIGGYPFETASAGELLDFYAPKGLELRRLVTTNGHGCNQLVFQSVTKPIAKAA
eukprot:TRINITY_DN1164_c0_g3_i2.p1 TRINITY_DN1164_c0_g3~~TRINITY_DN1164_c0_g3_i2.p1  ORF type:complete len:280 (-),score=29.38 TRINITY_DN1164_c0_g3_i2:550-1389(-)